MTSARTIRDFQVGVDIAPLVDEWARANHYGFRGTSADGTRRFQRGNGMLTWAMPFTIRQSGPAVHLEAWTHVVFLTRIFSFFLIPSDMGIESGGLRGALPRGIARDAVNKLLAQFDQPLIP